MVTSSIIALVVFFVVNLAAASSGAIFRPGAWYEKLKKPSWTPPNLAFPIVWTILYTANAVSGWLVWKAAGADALPVLLIYALSLIVNAAWSFLFFGLRRLDWALIDVALLWGSILIVALSFLPYSATAAFLQIPYLVWVTIAGFLNLRMVRLNGGAPA